MEKTVKPMPADIKSIFMKRALNQEELARLGRMPTKEEILALPTYGRNPQRVIRDYELVIITAPEPIPWWHRMLAVFVGIIIGLFGPAGLPLALWLGANRK